MLLRILLLLVPVGLFLIPWNPPLLREEAPIVGERVVITGASKGIGRELALEYARSGAALVIIARTQSLLDQVAVECRNLGATKAVALVADMSSDDAALANVIKQAATLLGKENDKELVIDTLILNHVAESGGISASPFVEIKNNMQILRDGFNINAFSYFSLALSALPYLANSANGKGRLVVVSSGSGVMPSPRTTPYNAAKHSLHGFFNALRLDLSIPSASGVSKMYTNISITTCVLGTISTETATKNTQGIYSPNISWSPADECAREIIRGARARLHTMYYPFFPIRFTSLLYSIWPSVVENLMKEFVIL